MTPADITDMTFAPLVESLAALLEKTFSPFKRCKKIGKGPRGDTNAQVRQWDCSKKGKYVQLCKGLGPMKGRTKIVRINPEYKSGYNSEYKPWEAAGRPGSKCKPGKEKVKAKLKGKKK